MQRMLRIILVLAACPNLVLGGQDDPQEARLDLNQIIRGTQKSEEKWLTLESWMIRYTHIRERIFRQPPFFPYPDNDIICARKGPWLFASERQGSADNPHDIIETWALWRDGRYTERIGNVANINDEAVFPNLISQMLFYHGGLYVDIMNDTIPYPKEALGENAEPAWFLPRCLKAHKAEYRVRKELEDVDGVLCHVVEWPKRDIIWIDAEHGFVVRRRQQFRPSGALMAEFKASNFQERSPGIWLPEKQWGIGYTPEDAPEPYRGKISHIVYNRLLEARFNDLPDDFFEVPLPKEVQVFDKRERGK